VSYTRLAAVLLAKAAMAYVVNLLVFGAYEEVPANAGEPVSYFFGLWTIEMPGHVTHFMLNGVSHDRLRLNKRGAVPRSALASGPAGILGGVIVLVAGHALVLGLGVTSAGLQGLYASNTWSSLTSFMRAVARSTTRSVTRETTPLRTK